MSIFTLRSKTTSILFALLILQCVGCNGNDDPIELAQDRETQAEKYFEESRLLFQQGGDSWIEPTLKAAELGHVMAMVNIADVNLDKPNCKGFVEGYEWLMKAVGQRSVIGMKRLAAVYESNACVEPNPTLVHKYRAQAALGGDLESIELFASSLLASSDRNQASEGAAWALIYLSRAGDTNRAYRFYENMFKGRLESINAVSIERYIQLSNQVGCYPLPYGTCLYSKANVLLTAQDSSLYKGEIVLRSEIIPH